MEPRVKGTSTMRGKSINRAIAGIGVLIAASALTFSVVAPAQADSIERSRNIPCPTPSGNSANYSWDAGIQTTSVYYNNQCEHEVKVTLTFVFNPGFRTECWSTPVGKGVQLFTMGLTDITKGC